MMGFKLSDPCPHCGGSLEVWFRSDMRGSVEAAVVHLNMGLRSDVAWRPVSGFENLVRLPEARFGADH